MHECENPCSEFVNGEYVLKCDIHLTYFDDIEGMVDIVIPKGYSSDFSIYHGWFLRLCPPEKYIRILMIYEYLCTHPDYERYRGFTFHKEEADVLFFEGMNAYCSPWWRTWLSYFALKLNADIWRKFRDDGGRA